MEDHSHVMVAAIDFGTTFSGYAFSFTSTPETIIMNKNWGENVGFASYKTHTSVLTTTDGEFVDFGFDAEEKYAGDLEDDEQTDNQLNLFRHFKMILHKTERMSRSTMVEATNGNKAPALNIFAHALNYLKNHLLDAVKRSVTSTPDVDMIRWVITVPAIWSEESKQFMREAAFKAGCIAQKDSRKLVIALEPEAASLCCRRMDIAKYPDGTDLPIETNAKYLVIDCGGGTVDITAHQVLAGGSIRELHSATGGAWGGTKVDERFVSLLRRVLGDRFIDGYQARCPQQWLVFMTNFEKLKKSVSLREKKSLNIPLSYSMSEEFPAIVGRGSIQDAIKAKRSMGVSFASGNIVINHDTAKSLFEPVVKTVIEHVEDLLSRREIQPCRLFFLVGGFSESGILQDMVKEAFRPRVKILIPSEAQMAVIKGAVLFGHKPKEIKSRVARLTYGCKVMQTMDNPLRFDTSRSIKIEGRLYCADVLAVFVPKDQQIELGERSRHTFGTTTTDQQVARVVLYSMDRKPQDVDYVDSEGISRVGEFIVDTPGRGVDRPVHIDVIFGGTEIQIDAEASGKPTSTKIDFMVN